MKRFNQTQILFAIGLAIIYSSVLFALEPASPAKFITSSYNNFEAFTEDKLANIEENLLIGVKSNNLGLQTSCAYYLGEMKSDLALIPLLRLARKGDSEEARIIAGLSLYKIESHIGLHILKGRAQNDESELVRKVFSRLYKVYVSNKYTF
jgi:HEAT repeat protein